MTDDSLFRDITLALGGIICGGAGGLLISWLLHKAQFRELREKIAKLESDGRGNAETNLPVSINPSFNFTMTGEDASRIAGSGQSVEGVIGQFNDNVVRFGTRYGQISVRLGSAEETQVDLVTWLHRNGLLAPLGDDAGAGS